jgi:hypothetical protein
MTVGAAKRRVRDLSRARGIHAERRLGGVRASYDNGYAYTLTATFAP